MGKLLTGIIKENALREGTRVLFLPKVPYTN